MCYRRRSRRVYRQNENSIAATIVDSCKHPNQSSPEALQAKRAGKWVENPQRRLETSRSSRTHPYPAACTRGLLTFFLSSEVLCVQHSKMFRTASSKACRRVTWARKASVTLAEYTTHQPPHRLGAYTEPHQLYLRATNPSAVLGSL